MYSSSDRPPPGRAQMTGMKSSWERSETTAWAMAGKIGLVRSGTMTPTCPLAALRVRSGRS
jgi:hypothetical protein